MSLSNVKGKWVVVLGASSGFGEAISLKLASLGINIVGVHLDRKSTQAHAEEVAQKIRNFGAKALFFNINAADRDKRREVLAQVKGPTEGKVYGLVHSLAFGTLKLFISKEEKERVSKEQLEMTLDVMANSLVYWTQDLFQDGFLQENSRIFAMTSSGSTRVWHSYGPVSAAKASLESHCRQLALELAPYKITVNAIRAGVTDTPALRKIPGNEKMIEMAAQKNPHRRLTTPEDVADMVALLMHEEAHWLTGNVLGIDGGEEITG